MRPYLLALYWCMGCLWPLSSLADDGDGADALLAALAEIHHLQGDFQQRQYDENGEVVLSSSGRFRLLRPGYFSWDIQQPDQQLVIADPDFIWHWDRDLETVTRRPLSDGGEMSPLQILGGDESTLRQSFSVVNQGEGVFLLTPLSGDMGFRRLSLQLRDATLVGMGILDQLDQRIDITFTNVDATTALEAADFAFSPPDGADVFYYDE